MKSKTGYFDRIPFKADRDRRKRRMFFNQMVNPNKVSFKKGIGSIIAYMNTNSQNINGFFLSMNENSAELLYFIQHRSRTKIICDRPLLFPKRLREIIPR